MNMHWLRILLPGLLVNEARAETLDLHTGAGLLLDILDEHTLITMSDNIIMLIADALPGGQQPSLEH
jgi:hypothetical protein